MVLWRTWSGVFKSEVLIWEFSAIDWFSTLENLKTKQQLEYEKSFMKDVFFWRYSQKRLIKMKQLQGFLIIFTSAIVMGEITTLNHEVRDDTMERAALVAHHLSRDCWFSITNAESSEILSSLRNNVCVELNKRK